MGFGADLRENQVKLPDPGVGEPTGRTRSLTVYDCLAGCWAVSVLSLGALTLCAQDLASFEKRTTVKVLPNGLTLIICERPEAPVFSFYTEVNAGSADDPGGQSGLAHMFEHMAFKGTEQIGTTNYPAEKVALAKVES
jgi:hypothetical protein